MPILTGHGVPTVNWTARPVQSPPSGDLGGEGLVGEVGYNIDWYNPSATTFTLTTPQQLAGLSYLVKNGNTFAGKTILLGDNIDLSAGVWTAIGTLDDDFKGTFDGQGHTVSGVYINTDQRYQGLFGYVSGGTLRNVGVINSYIKSSGDDGIYVGGLAGFVNTNATVEQCYSEATVEGYYYVGSLIGDANNNVGISDCYATGSATAGNQVGALIGHIDGNVTLTRCYASGAVSGQPAGYYGGVVGSLNGQTITSCYYDNTANTGGTYSGGIAKTPAELRRRGTYEGWSFGWVWSMDASRNNGMPVLTMTQPDAALTLTQTGDNAYTLTDGSGTALASGTATEVLEYVAAYPSATTDTISLAFRNAANADTVDLANGLMMYSGNWFLTSGTLRSNMQGGVVYLPDGSSASLTLAGATVLNTGSDGTLTATAITLGEDPGTPTTQLTIVSGSLGSNGSALVYRESANSLIDIQPAPEFSIAVGGNTTGSQPASITLSVSDTLSNPLSLPIYYQWCKDSTSLDGDGTTSTRTLANPENGTYTLRTYYICRVKSATIMAETKASLSTSNAITLDYLLRVSNAGNDATIFYDGSDIDLSTLFTIDPNAGAATYTIETGTTGEGSISGSALTVTKAATFTIGLTTAATATHDAGAMVTATLTVEKGRNPAYPPTPTIASSTGTSVTLNVVAGVQYSIDGGSTWQTSSSFSDLTEGNTYCIAACYPENNLYGQSDAYQLLVFTLTGGTAIALDDSWLNSVSPYYISTAAQLRSFAYKVNSGRNFSGETIYLAADIDLNAGMNVNEAVANGDTASLMQWTAIGNNLNFFKGTFDGQGHAVSGVYINTDQPYQGLFGSVEGGTLRNVGVVNSYVKSSGGGNGYYVGGLAGYVGNNSTVSSCYSEATVEGGYYVGSLIGGASNNVGISDCYATGSATASNQVGALIGHIDGNVTLTHCYATGAVWQPEGYYGGVVGEANGQTITSCYYDNTANTGGTSSGGIGKSTADMKRQSTYEGWDFGYTWSIAAGRNNGYPTLQMRAKPAVSFVLSQNADSTYNLTNEATGNNVVSVGTWTDLAVYLTNNTADSLTYRLRFADTVDMGSDGHLVLPHGTWLLPEGTLTCSDDYTLYLNNATTLYLTGATVLNTNSSQQSMAVLSEGTIRMSAGRVEATGQMGVAVALALSATPAAYTDMLCISGGSLVAANNLLGALVGRASDSAGIRIDVADAPAFAIAADGNTTGASPATLTLAAADTLVPLVGLPVYYDWQKDGASVGNDAALSLVAPGPAANGTYRLQARYKVPAYNSATNEKRDVTGAYYGAMSNAITLSYVNQKYAVTTTANAGAGSLREAIEVAAYGDTISCAPIAGNTVYLDSTLTIYAKKLVVLGYGITLDGSRMATATAGKQRSIINMTYGMSSKNNPALDISRVRFANAANESYGAIRVPDLGALVARSCIFSDNTAKNSTTGLSGGGAINAATGADITLLGCTFYGNRSESAGGAIYFGGDGGKMVLAGNLFVDNKADMTEVELAPGLTLTMQTDAIAALDTLPDNVAYNAYNGPSAYLDATHQVNTYSWPGTGNLDLTGQTGLLSPADLVPQTPVLQSLGTALPQDYPTEDFYGNPIAAAGTRSIGAVQYFYVAFESNGGSKVDTIFAAYGSSIAAPQPPTRSGYIFVGWYYEEDFKTLEDFQSLRLVKDATLYASWQDATVAPPTPATGLTYTGSEQTAFTLPAHTTLASGTNKATNAGSYTAELALESGYVWSDGGGSANRSISWSIAKAAQDAPDLSYVIGYSPTNPDTVTITEVSGAEYNIDGKGWSSNRIWIAPDPLPHTVVLSIRMAADANHFASDSVGIAVATDKTAQSTLAITPVPAKAYGDADFTLQTTGGSGSGAVTFTRTSGADDVATVSAAGLVHIAGAGSIKVKATKAADDAYNEAVSAELTIIVNKAAPQFTKPTGLTGVSGATLASVIPALPSGWAWNDAATQMLDTGSQPFPATWTSPDANHRDSAGIALTVNVAPLYVAFNSNGGSKVDTIFAPYGTSIAAPQPPSRSGYTFGGWYHDAALQSLEDFQSLSLSSNLTLYAKWTPVTQPPATPKYTLTFESNGGSAVSPITLDSGTMVSPPPAPTRSGHTFAGWFKDQGLSALEDFKSFRLLANTTLYAKWTPVTQPETPKYLITWVVNGRTEYQDSVPKDVMPVYLGSRPTKPIDKDSIYDFVGWQPKMVKATANATYTAMFKGTARPATAVAATGLAVLRLYPNPTTGQLSIVNHQLTIGDRVEVYSMQGTLVKQFTTYNAQCTVDLTPLPAGTYIVRVGKALGTVVKK